MSAFKWSLLLLWSMGLHSCMGQTAGEQVPQGTVSRELGTVTTVLDNQIWKIFQDTKGNYWFGSQGKGIYCLAGGVLKLYTTVDGLVSNTIRGIQEDRIGNIYVETPEGISRFDGKTFITLRPFKSPNNQWKLEANDLWFGYNVYDVYRYDGISLFELKLPRQDLKTAFGEEPEGLSFKGLNNTPYAVFGVDKDRYGHIWFGTATAGAFRYDGKSFLWFGEKELTTLPDGRVPGVRSIIQDKHGYYWLSNFYSKYKIDPAQPKGYEKSKAVDLPLEQTKGKILYFNSGIADTKGNLWMTTYGGGLWKYDGERLTNLDIKKGAEDVLLVSIYQDHSGTIWLGTDNDGVYRQNGETFEKFVFQK